MSRTTISSAAAVLATLGALACDASSKSGAPTAPESVPLFTVASGVRGVVLVRANAGIIKAHSDYNGFKTKLSTHEDTDIVMNNNFMTAGGHSGWHTHPGITIVAIKSGSLTLYDGDDALCQPRTYTAGQVFVEEGGHVHMARNEGSVGAEWYTTYIAPTGGATRLDAPAPGNCPF